MDPFSFVTPTASADGYGLAGEMLALAAVRDHGADVQVIGHDWADERFSAPDFLRLKVSEALIPERDLVAVFFLPFALARFRSRVTLSMTMWETDQLPARWASLLNRFADGVIVPSAACREVFERSVGVPVRVVPFGTDTDFYLPVERRPVGPCKFLMAGLIHFRKGLEFALRAFREEFTAGEDVQLTLKTRLTFLDAGEEWRTLHDPRVRIIADDYTRDEMRRLYYGSDCFLAPSRGEGSGLTPRDAMATGLPTILTDWSGLADVADPRYNWPIPVEDLEVAPPENTSYGAGVTGGGPIGNFARPSVPALRAAMREVYEDRAAAYERGRAAAAWMAREWTWTRCAGRWLEALGELTAVKLADRVA